MYKLYFITLNRQKKRLKNVVKNMECLKNEYPKISHKIQPEIFNAITPHDVFIPAKKNIIKSEYKKYISDEFIRKSIKSKMPNKIPCAISHIKVWEQIIEQDLDMALIIEDDMIFLPRFFKKITKILKKMDSDICFLYIPPKIFKDKPKFQLKSKHLIQPFPGYWGNTGYIITKQAAQKLINQYLPLHDFKDLTIKNLIEKNHLKSEIVTKNLIENLGCNSLNCKGCKFGSTINKSNKKYHLKS